MCGRFTITVTIDELLSRYLIESVPFRYIPRYNAAPGQLITSIIANKGKNRIGQLKWGLVPSWAKDEKIGYKLINARAETLQEKASFKKIVHNKRCIIPVDGFYEWKKTNGMKQPMRIQLKDQSVFSLAGLYDTWVNSEGEKLHSCTIITTEPNQLMLHIHDRMPVILNREEENQWLNHEQYQFDSLKPLFKPYPSDQMMAYPVSNVVGNVKNDSPECIEEYTEPLLF
ncbi:SOS response-associated peptidase [Chengkuizengella axinellae]|uniref:Abasic site processing protein n=1 Tax=Chengkuizengella axinellae TaxID=3064388 RepID=A0ABT9J4I5_9BACL|nr:SOS response-associated peptidase [Chengkuizengella sp. 2205SS18-9]MDP5276377.1 SOS response-associated peptidase [Chengkuizengella sp. 2205SS18-9]